MKIQTMYSGFKTHVGTGTNKDYKYKFKVDGHAPYHTPSKLIREPKNELSQDPKIATILAMNTQPTTIALGSDHGGLELKESVKAFLLQNPQLRVIDLGTHTQDSVNYPDFAKKVCTAISQKEAALGLLFCGTGIGISIAANRFPGIRAALIHSDFTAEMAKAHNNANILCLGGRTTTPEEAKRWITIWLQTQFEGGRHETRLKSIEINT